MFYVFLQLVVLIDFGITAWSSSAEECSTVRIDGRWNFIFQHRGNRYPFYSGCHHGMCCMGFDFLSNWFISGVMELNIAALDASSYALLGCFQRLASKTEGNKDGLLNWLVLLRYFPAFLLCFLFGCWNFRGKQTTHSAICVPNEIWSTSPVKSLILCILASSLNTIKVQGPLYLSGDNHVIFCIQSPLLCLKFTLRHTRWSSVRERACLALTFRLQLLIPCMLWLSLSDWTKKCSFLRWNWTSRRANPTAAISRLWSPPDLDHVLCIVMPLLWSSPWKTGVDNKYFGVQNRKVGSYHQWGLWYHQLKEWIILDDSFTFLCISCWKWFQNLNPSSS